MLALSQVHHLTTRRACFLSQQGKYGIGSQVEVLRTDGTWSLAQVKEYDWRAVTYTVMLPDTRLKYAALTLARMLSPAHGGPASQQWQQQPDSRRNPLSLLLLLPRRYFVEEEDLRPPVLGYDRYASVAVGSARPWD